MSEPVDDLGGDWIGVYSYPGLEAPVVFHATLTDKGASLAGHIREEIMAAAGAPVTVMADVRGGHAERQVRFVKTYDGAAGWTHKVHYVGTLTPDGLEIAGTWSIPPVWTGTFLMSRAPGLGETAVVEAFERA